MKDELISFETAKLAKEKEFAYEFNKQLPDYVPIFYCESDNDDNLDLTTLRETECQGEDIERCDFYFRPTQSLLQKWLREVHHIDISIFISGADTYEFYIHKNRKRVEYNVDSQTLVTFENHKILYETTLEAGLLKGLKLINNE